MATAEWEDSDGGRHGFVVAASAAIDTTVTPGYWRGVIRAVTFRKNFRWTPAQSIPAGETFLATESPALRRLAILVVGQSNGEGRGLTSNASAIVNAAMIALNWYPYDENLSGPGGTQCVGPALALADTIAGYDTVYDRITIYCTATGSQSVAALYGSDGDDGTYAMQRDDLSSGIATVIGGVQTENTCLLLPDDDYVLLYNQGEADAGVQTDPATWTSAVNTLFAKAQSDYSGSTCLAILVCALAETNETVGGTQASWDDIRDAQLALADSEATPPIFVRPYVDDEKKVGDEIHYTATGQERIAGALAEDIQAILEAAT